MDEFRSTTHRAYREAMVTRVLELERALGFAEMVPIPWHEWQIIGNWEVVNHAGLKAELRALGVRWENYLSDTWTECMVETFGPAWKKSTRPLPEAFKTHNPGEPRPPTVEPPALLPRVRTRRSRVCVIGPGPRYGG